MFDDYFNSDMNDSDLATIINRDFTTSTSTIGWCQFIRRSNYIDSFMMNENFYAWGPEDCELHYRLLVMGNQVDRIQEYVYHLEHSRTQDSWFNNPKWQENINCGSGFGLKIDNNYLHTIETKNTLRREL